MRVCYEFKYVNSKKSRVREFSMYANINCLLLGAKEGTHRGFFYNEIIIIIMILYFLFLTFICIFGRTIDLRKLKVLILKKSE